MVSALGDQDTWTRKLIGPDKYSMAAQLNIVFHIAHLWHHLEIISTLDSQFTTQQIFHCLQ